MKLRRVKSVIRILKGPEMSLTPTHMDEFFRKFSFECFIWVKNNKIRTL